MSPAINNIRHAVAWTNPADEHRNYGEEEACFAASENKVCHIPPPVVSGIDVVPWRFAEVHRPDDDDDEANPKSYFLRYQISDAINTEVAHRINYSIN